MAIVHWLIHGLFMNTWFTRVQVGLATCHTAGVHLCRIYIIIYSSSMDSYLFTVIYIYIYIYIYLREPIFFGIILVMTAICYCSHSLTLHTLAYSLD